MLKIVAFFVACFIVTQVFPSKTYPRIDDGPAVTTSTSRYDCWNDPSTNLNAVLYKEKYPQLSINSIKGVLCK